MSDFDTLLELSADESSNPVMAVTIKATTRWFDMHRFEARQLKPCLTP